MFRYFLLLFVEKNVLKWYYPEFDSCKRIKTP